MNRAEVKKQILIIGAGGHGKEVAVYLGDLIRQGTQIEILGFIDEEKPAGPFAGSEILGGLEYLKTWVESRRRGVHYITAIGDNSGRKRLVERIEALGCRQALPWSLIHPQAFIGSEVQIGEGTCVTPAAIITGHVSLGKHSIINVRASISHDCVIGNFVNLNPSATICGNVTVGEGSFIGAGATIIEKVTIGEWAVVGAGAVVIGDIPPYSTAVGVPARVIKQHTPVGFS